ncbi:MULTISPECIES: TetR/AcrR family transcriptional regulator [Nocardiaceae]|uniref:AcrR family transcriptional regulator n=1 Tax=Rhodococcoides corynebacterioides TaxID=53972 RepID=A0ABS2KQ19_9NOCA|nr:MULTISPECIES: TetR/AcrR family transcriptional regulator [Rhodococcus]MBM7414069.1 AcrR family transcriptional regulator [Rhodococcus corynebacterioides]MBP1116532.1 AcrR family transcriptional regulator [Rhodococcus sp. PvP016]
MDSVKRTRLSPEQRRAQLIDLGVEMLSERTLDAISVEDIADQAGVSRGLLFHYFSSKHDFHVAIVEHTSRQMLDATEPPVGLDPLTTLAVALASYVDYVTEHRSSYVSLLRGTASGDPDMRAVFERTRDVMVERTVSQFPLLGVECTPRIALAIRGWVAFCEEVTITWLNQEDLSRDELIELLVHALPAVVLPTADTTELSWASADAG